MMHCEHFLKSLKCLGEFCVCLREVEKRSFKDIVEFFEKGGENPEILFIHPFFVI